MSLVFDRCYCCFMKKFFIFRALYIGKPFSSAYGDFKVCANGNKYYCSVNRSLKTISLKPGFSYYVNCYKFFNIKNLCCKDWKSAIRTVQLAYVSSKSTSQGNLADELLARKSGFDSSTGTSDKPKDLEDRQDVEATKERNKEQERTWKAIKFTFIAFGIMMSGLGGFLIITWGSPAHDALGSVIPDEFSDLPIVQQYFKRTLSEARNMNRMIQEPSREKLLPDPLKEPYIQPQFTLVMEMRDVLVHPEWKTAFPVLDQLDTNGFVWYRLFRDSTRYENGKHIKDLNCLNRDLSKVIMVDWDPQAVSSPRNHLCLKRWDGDMNDKALMDLGVMLRTIAESDVSDVRDVLDYYRSFDDPVEAFRENQQAAEQQEILLKQKAEEERQLKGLTASWSSSFLRRR